MKLETIFFPQLSLLESVVLRLSTVAPWGTMATWQGSCGIRTKNPPSYTTCRGAAPHGPVDQRTHQSKMSGHHWSKSFYAWNI